ncbi:hypothetical protein [Microcoleus sp. B3-A4]|uniref:hypothetical protein n=1 Tax=Microcoleus sp. B3-A4 TaxID=2818653 RepID=UPI002FD39CAF
MENPRQQTDISAIRQKPFGSRIELKEDGENLEILIPPKRLTFGSAFWILIGTLFCLGLVLLAFICIINVIIGHLEVGFMLVFLIVLVGTGFSILWEAITFFFRGTRIKIDRKQISVTHLWPEYKCQVTPIMNKNLNNNIMYIRHSMASSEQEEYYETLKLSQLTPPEIEWLANEISAFSGGKITVVSADNKYVKIPTAK